MHPYLDLLDHIRHHGTLKDDRTGVGTLSAFGCRMRFDLSQGFPAVTTKRLFFRGVKEELLWFLRGATDATELQERGVHIWDEWAGPDGDLGPIYGRQWRSWPTPDGGHIDQLDQVRQALRHSPDSRRHVVSAWNVAELDAMGLAPCHILFQFYVAPADTGPPRLSCQLYQRSADMFLGVPFNIASYALLTHMVAADVGLAPGELIHVLGDTHIYNNHLAAVDEQLARAPLALPALWLNPQITDLFAFGADDIALEDYRSHGRITAPVAV